MRPAGTIVNIIYSTINILKIYLTVKVTCLSSLHVRPVIQPTIIDEHF
jgi:hypothetical protein